MSFFCVDLNISGLPQRLFRSLLFRNLQREIAAGFFITEQDFFAAFLAIDLKLVCFIHFIDADLIKINYFKKYRFLNLYTIFLCITALSLMRELLHDYRDYALHYAALVHLMV